MSNGKEMLKQIDQLLNQYALGQDDVSPDKIQGFSNNNSPNKSYASVLSEVNLQNYLNLPRNKNFMDQVRENF